MKQILTAYNGASGPPKVENISRIYRMWSCKSKKVITFMNYLSRFGQKYNNNCKFSPTKGFIRRSPMKPSEILLCSHKFAFSTLIFSIEFAGWSQKQTNNSFLRIWGIWWPSPRQPEKIQLYYKTEYFHKI